MSNMDKLWHFIAGAILMLGLCVFFPVRYSLLCVIVIAYLKELFDLQHPDKHTSDANDFIATVVGGLTGVTLI